MATLRDLQLALKETLDDLEERDQIIDELEVDLDEKEQMIIQLQQDLDRLTNNDEEKAYNLSLQSTDSTASTAIGRRRFCVSAEPSDLVRGKEFSIQKVHKPPLSTQLIQQSLQDHDFFRRLDGPQIRETADCMYMVEYKKHTTIFRETDFGNTMYIVEEGKVEVTKDGRRLTTLGCGKVFGELGVLFHYTRTKTVRAITACKLWCIDRTLFQCVMMKTGLIKQTEYIEFIKNVPDFKVLTDENITKLSDLLEENHYENGSYIIRQGARGDTFYIISKGRVRVTQTTSRIGEEEYVKTLYTGDYFGEKSLESEDKRTFNAIAADQHGCDCLVVDRESFSRAVCRIDDQLFLTRNEKTVEDQFHEECAIRHTLAIRSQLNSLRLHDLTIIATLGVGGFGRVELVQVDTDSKKTYVLKMMRKDFIVERKNEQNIMNEKKVLLDCNSPFLCRLYRTYKDTKYLYMLSEVCLGGDLFTYLRERGPLVNASARFYIGCAVEALSYLHTHRFGPIVYRDLKPENFVFDNIGYLKLTDFGTAKQLVLGKKTWTFCGTPQYTSPEIMLGVGHDISTDYWSLGILTYELLNGLPPFNFTDVLQIFKVALRGIDSIEFPSKMSKHAVNMIKKLCRTSPAERLGYLKGGIIDIRKHQWFDGFAWDGLKSRTVKSPYIPKIKSAIDFSNFDEIPEDDSESPADDFTLWDKDF